MNFECQAFFSMRIPRAPFKLLLEFEVKTDSKCFADGVGILDAEAAGLILEEAFRNSCIIYVT